MPLKIVTIEQPEYTRVLKSKAHVVSFPLDDDDRELIVHMKDKLEALGGVGLAAPQVNVPRQIIAVYIPEEATLLRDNVDAFYPMHIMINPTYEPVSQAVISYDFEGCYSVSSKAGKVPRYHQINVSYQDMCGHAHQLLARGFYARVLQHEIDHLNGILIVDRLTLDCVQGSAQDMALLRRAELSEDRQVIFDKLMAKKSKN